MQAARCDRFCALTCKVMAASTSAATVEVSMSFRIILSFCSRGCQIDEKRDNNVAPHPPSETFLVTLPGPIRN